MSNHKLYLRARSERTWPYSLGRPSRFFLPIAAVLLCSFMVAFAADPSPTLPTSAQSAPAPSAGSSPQFRYVKGRVLVQPRAGLSDDQFDKILRQHGGRRASKSQQLGVHVIELPATANEQAVVNALRSNPHIKFAELDRAAPPNLTVNDQYFPNEWHLTKNGAPTAWGTATGSGVIIAILDSGVDGSHPDLIANLVPGWNFYDNNSNTSDVQGHGTGVAGIAAAVGNDTIGVAGVS